MMKLYGQDFRLAVQFLRPNHVCLSVTVSSEYYSVYLTQVASVLLVFISADLSMISHCGNNEESCFPGGHSPWKGIFSERIQL